MFTRTFCGITSKKMFAKKERKGVEYFFFLTEFQVVSHVGERSRADINHQFILIKNILFKKIQLSGHVRYGARGGGGQNPCQLRKENVAILKEKIQMFRMF